MARNTYEAPKLQAVFDGMRSDYQAAKTSRYRRRRTGVVPTGSGADYHYRTESDFFRLMEQARDFQRNDSLIGPLIHRAVENVVQTGFSLDANTGNAELDRILETNFSQWAGDPELCDLAGEATFYDLEQITLRQALVDGDIFALGTTGGQLELVESHRVRTPRNTKRSVVHGILLDSHRRRLEYWVTKDEIEPTRSLAKVSDINPVRVRDDDGFRHAFHVYDPQRISQTRGVTALAPCFDNAGMFEDILFARLVQQQVVSCFSVFRMQDERAEQVAQRGERTTETLSDGSTRTIEGLAPGMELIGNPGETLEGFSPAVPNAEFFPFVRLVMQTLAINLGLPLQVLLLDPTETNFSGWRGALDQARIGWRRNQKWLQTKFHSPVYVWKVRQWIADDPGLARLAAQSGVDPFRHGWRTPRWPYVEPLKDAGADLLRVRNALTSPRRLHAEHSADWDEVSEEIVTDNALAIARAKAAAKQINAQHADGQAVHWRELLSLPTPDGVQVDLSVAADETEPEETPADAAA